MSNVVEFILKLKDMMSGGMQQAATAAQRAMNAATQATQRVAGANRAASASVANSARASSATATRSIATLERALRMVERRRKISIDVKEIGDANKTIENLKSRIANMKGGSSGSASSARSGGSGGAGESSGGGLLGSLVGGNLISQGISAIFSAGKQAAGFVISSYAKKEQDLIGLQTFLGKQGAKDAYANIQKDAAATPFDTESLLGVNRALISSGLNAKDARKDALSLANAISAVGGGNDELGRMAANMQQIKTVGKATAMDIRQFGMTGINIYQLLANATGKSIEKVKDMEISYDLLSKALEMSAQKGGMYFGAMEAQSQTMSGRWNTFLDNAKIGAIGLGEAFSPVINKVIDIASQFAQNIPQYIEGLKPYIQWISDKISGILDWFSSLSGVTGNWAIYLGGVKNMLGIVWDYNMKIFSVIGNVVKTVVDFVGHSKILRDVFSVIQFTMSKTGAMLGRIVDIIGALWENVVKPMLNGIDNVYRFISGAPTIAKEVKNQEQARLRSNANDVFEQVQLNHQRAVADDVFKTVQAKLDAKDKKKSVALSLGSTDSSISSPSVTGGGPKTITINMNKEVIGQLSIISQNIKEGVGDMENLIEEAVRRVFYSLESAQ